MSVTELGIGGMTCASCAAHVADALREVPGVSDAAVNLATERARVTHAGNVNVSALIGAVEGVGYEAHAELDDVVEQQERISSLQRKGMLLAIAVGFSAATMALSMLVPDFPNKVWLLGALALPVWAVVGWEFHRGAGASLRSGKATMDTLISLGSTAAFAIGYFETASAIVTLVYIGKYLEARAKLRSGAALRALLDLQPRTADGIRVGDTVKVAPGERIPVDGIVIEGTSTVDRSMMTGEPIPVDVRAKSTVEAGTINGDGALTVRATAVGAGTELARIIAIVRNAQGSMPPVQRLADRYSAIFVPVILAIAAATFAGWMITHHTWNISLLAAVAVLVVACPCALGLATPTAIIAGVGRAARIGVLFKDASSLEAAASVDTVVFDKTGTLTLGTPRVTNASDEVLSIAAAVEATSTHPLARAVVAAARERHLTIPDAVGAQASRGFGLRAMVNDAPVLVGNATFLSGAGVDVPGDDNGATHAYVARSGALLGRIDFSDATHPQARATIAALRSDGIACAIVSGDAREPVARVAGEVGVEKFIARATPVTKAQFVDDLREAGASVAFVGDGINDAPALARANVGIAMGSGTAVALETAGVAILSNNPANVAPAIELGRATMRTIKQNLFWAFAYNVVLVPLAIAGIVTPVFAAAAMGLSSLFVVGNSLRLSRG